MPETNDNTQPVSKATTARAKFEQERLSRRAALRKIGMTTGMALFGMFAVDDLARVAIKKMEAQKATREIGEAVAREFKDSGIVFAASGSSSSGGPCTACIENCVEDAEYECIPCEECDKPASTASASTKGGVAEGIAPWTWFRRTKRKPCGGSCHSSLTCTAKHCQDCCDTACAEHDPRANSPWFNCYKDCDLYCTG